ncbi:class A beta-lactamase [Actinocorallia sp. A-T 12471]|uniref:class A beta-lactamase n=1 Tax=Actinocorallia sp. A-T 12471 TaxID=3089813 RepID=UPI0029D2C751|nr:class A beta-lactamase [Actinocorallia sp. A-T 12471]MDX6741084.1 class A beta-lactamase [Actinocorallia sp. A-T 12471]
MQVRAAFAALLAAVMASGCAAPAPSAPSGPPSPTSSASALAGLDRSDSARRALRALEREYDARLGVWALDTGTGDFVGFNADERFAFASTFKPLVCGVLLQRASDERLAAVVRWKAADVVANSPVTARRTARGMTLAQLCEAAIRHSDNTAVNLVLAEIGGPKAFTEALRALGDDATRADRIEPAMSDVPPGDERDTTTPRAFATDLGAFLLGDALPDSRRTLLTDWLSRPLPLSAEIRSGVPEGWRVHGKTGTTRNGGRNYIAVARPPGGSPILLATMSTREDPAQSPDDALLSSALTTTVAALTP